MRRLVATLLLAALAVPSCSPAKPRADVPRWPEVAEVERITAAITESESGQPGLPEFEVPSEYTPLVLRALSPPEHHEHPPKFTREVGQLRIACRDGRTLEVRLIFFGKEPTLFTVGGVPCIRGGPYVDLGNGKWPKYLPEVYAVEGLLRAIHRRDRAGVDGLIMSLDQSAGRVAPPPREP